MQLLKIQFLSDDTPYAVNFVDSESNHPLFFNSCQYGFDTN